MQVAIDVTEQVTARKKIEESEEKFRSLIEEAPVATCLFVGRKLTIEVANEAMIRVWGKGPSVIGKPLAEALPELEGQHFLPLLDDLYTTGKSYKAKGGRADLVVDGKLQNFYFDYDFKPLRDTAGGVYAIMETAIDVTAQILAKKALEENERNLRNTILQASFAICIFRGPQFVIEIANESMLQFWGKGKEVVGKPVFEALPEVKGQGYEEILSGVLQSGNPFSANELSVTLPRAGVLQTVYVNFAYEPIREFNGSISGIMATTIDVTDQVLARQKIEEVVAERTKELAAANLSLERNNRELEQFAYIASHDLQEPLRKVTTFTQMLKSNLGEVDAKSATYFNKITASTLRMIDLVRDVLEFSQLSNKQRVFEPMDIGALIDDLTSDFELAIEQKGAMISHRDLPTFSANALQMRQLFGNLLSNALKFTREGVPPVISISSAVLSDEEKEVHKDLLPDINYCIITVEDNGIGFSEEHAEKIFSIFQRLHGKTEFAGTGIGLALCKKIAQNHHGEIWATSQPGSGTTFHIILPCK